VLVLVPGDDEVIIRRRTQLPALRSDGLHFGGRGTQRRDACVSIAIAFGVTSPVNGSTVSSRPT